MHAREVGQRLRRIGAGDPQCLDLAPMHGLEQFHRGEAGLGWHVGDAPQTCDFRAMLGVGHVAVRGKQVGQAADFAPAHGVGLAGQRKRAAAGFADLAGGEVQVDDGGIVIGAVAGLVEALAVKRERSRRPAEPARGGDDVVRLHTADVGGHGRRVVAHQSLQRIEALGVGADVVGVRQVFPEQHVEHGVVERNVGAGQDGQVQVGGLGGVGAARVDDDEFHFGAGRARVLDATEQHRMRPGGIRPGDQQAVGMGDVLVGTRRRVGAQRGLVAGHGGAHAQARVGVDVVGADQSLGQLVEDVVVLRHELAADVKGDAVGAVLADGAGEFLRGMVERGVPAHPFTRCGLLAAQFRMHQALRHDLRRHGQVQRAALGAQAPEVGRMLGVAAHAGDAGRVVFDDYAAADAAVGAGGSGFRQSQNHMPQSSQRAQRKTSGLSLCPLCPLWLKGFSFQLQPDGARFELDGKGLRAALVRRHGGAVLEADLEAVQRAGHGLAVHDALR